MITHKQLSLADIFTDCQNKFDNDKYQFLALLENIINLDEIVPVSFISLFHGPAQLHLYPIGTKILNLFRNYLKFSHFVKVAM